MHRTDANNFHHYRSDSRDRELIYRPPNQPSNDCTCPSSLLQDFQNNPNLQDPSCLNKILVPLLIKLLQNQNTCRHCSEENQAQYRHQHRPSYKDRETFTLNDGFQQSYQDLQPQTDEHATVKEARYIPPGKYRSSEYILAQPPPPIQRSNEGTIHASCDTRVFCDSMRRRNLIPSCSYHNEPPLRTEIPPPPEPKLVERCYWCFQQLYQYYDSDCGKRVFTHFPNRRGAKLTPAGKSSHDTIRQVSLVDTSPFDSYKDVMLPCPYLCAKTDTTYNSSYRHPEIVAKEAQRLFMPPNSDPREQMCSSNLTFGQSSLESLGRRDKAERPRYREETVMLIKPNYWPSVQSQKSDLSRVFGTGGPIIRNTAPAAVSFSPSTDEYQERRSIEKEGGGYILYSKPSYHRRHRSSQRSRSSSAKSHPRSTRSHQGRCRRKSSGRRGRRHSAPSRSRSRSRSRSGTRTSRRQRAISICDLRRPHRSRSRRRRHRQGTPRHNMSYPTMTLPYNCLCGYSPGPTPPSVYSASYGNPADHPYYEGPAESNFRRQRITDV